MTAEFDRDERRATKAYFDAMGHYTRWDAVSLNVSHERLDPISRDESHSLEPESARDATNLSPAVVQELSEKYDIPIGTLDAVLTDITEGQTGQS